MDRLFDRVGTVGVWVLAAPTIITGVVAVLAVARTPKPSLALGTSFFFFLGFLFSCLGLVNVSRSTGLMAASLLAAILACAVACLQLIEDRRTTELFFSLMATALGCLQTSKQYGSGS